MCGLWASVGFEPPRRVIELVAHRGPDGGGWEHFDSLAGPVVLAHRRLAIFDLDSRSDQPMQTMDKRFAIVFNGAIYNYTVLRDELEILGHRFVTSGDTEVLLASFAQWGEDCLHRLNGMFSFAIHDRQEGYLFAARDRFGIKPLYVCAGERGIAFASELKQLLAIPGVQARVDHDALYDFLRFGMTDHGTTTCFQGLRPVPGGHYVRIDLQPRAGFPRSSEMVGMTRWYHPPDTDYVMDNIDIVVSQVRETFRDATKLRLQSDVPVASCLSGGIDSSAIVGAIAELHDGQAQHTISAVYPNDIDVDESQFVDAVLDFNPQIRGHRVVPAGPDIVKHLDTLLWHQEQPFASTSIFAQWCVFQEARTNGFAVMLDGQGADELFGGYPYMTGLHIADLVARGRLAQAAAAASALRKVSAFGIVRQARWIASALMPEPIVERAKVLLAESAMTGWLQDVGGVLRSPAIHPAERTARDGQMLSQMRRMTFETSLPMLLRFEDRNSMAHGIETRLPFLDHRIVELALSTHGNLNIRNGETKWILREAVSPYLPDVIRKRHDKIGFATPEIKWIRGPLCKTAHTAIEHALEALPLDMLDRDRARRECAEMIDGTRAYDTALWRLWCAGRWVEQFSVSP